jgi:MSHA biogenesis protein MshJ
VIRYWHRLQELLDARALRERVLIFAAVAGVVLLGGYEAVIRPVMDQRQDLVRQTRQVQQETRGLRTRIQELTTKDYQAETARLEKRRSRLKEALARRKDALGEKVGQFIEPRRLMAFFEDLLLARNPGGIQVLRVESLPREAVDIGASEGQSGPELGLYRKGVAVGFRADFEDTLGFLDRLEALEWAVQVTKVDYSVLEYPRAEISLVAHTFLMDANGAANGD